MDYSAMDKVVYGNQDLEDDPELMAELLALEQEEHQCKTAPSASVIPRPKPVAPTASFGIDPATLATALSDNVPDNIEDLENDEDLLNELSDLVGQPMMNSPSVKTSASNPSKPIDPPRVAPPPPSHHGSSSSYHLNELLKCYEKMKLDSEKENNAPKTRRLQRSIDKIKTLIVKADKGLQIDSSEIPPAPPGWQPSGLATPIQAAPLEPIKVPSVARPALPENNPVRVAAQTSNNVSIPPPIPARMGSSITPLVPVTSTKKDEIVAILQRRKMAFVENGKAAIAANDKKSALEFVDKSKQFDQAIIALESVSVDEIDLADIPKTPPPYRKQPTSFVEHLEYRLQRYQAMMDIAKKEGNDRKIRMYARTVNTYQEAIATARSGRLVNVEELSSLPDMPVLPPQKTPTQQTVTKPTGPVAGVKSPPAVGPLADSGPSGVSRNATQLQFLLQRQAQFKEAAIAAKNEGDLELAKKYLLNAKGFDKMIAASRNGLPVNIKDTPIPPQVSTSASTLQPKITPSTTSVTGDGGRGEALSMLENGFIEQIQLAENSRMKFTRLGDVGKVKLFEGWAKAAKQDLILIREVAKQGLKIPKFHIEQRQIPSADLFPDLAEDVIELTISCCRDVPLPAGYETTHANIFVRYTFPFPVENPQTGKTKCVAGTTSPEFDEVIIFQIDSKKSRGSKLLRVLKRSTLKLEVFQKGGFLRSDKLLGTCEWKLDELEGKAEMEESIPLKEGRKAVGGLSSLKVRIREPLGDSKLQILQHKWIVLDA